jgi:hypothetical protein
VPRYESAVTFQERAVNMWGHDVGPASLKLLEEYRARAKSDVDN